MSKQSKLPGKGSKEYDALKDHLYSKKKILGEDSPFSEILQNLVNEMLEGEIESFLETDEKTINPNKRNGKIPKRVMSEAGPLYIKTPRDRKGDFEPSLIEKRLVICTDNLKGFSEAIMHIFPSSIVQKCIVHQVRNSLQYVDDKDRKTIVKELRKIYTAPTREQAEMSMDAFEVKWSTKYSYIIKQWRTNWEELIAFMSFSQDMRRMIYTTNPVEALHRIIRKITKGKAAWVSETALMKQIYLSLMQNEKSWRRKAHGWKSIQRDLIEKYGDRIQV